MKDLRLPAAVTIPAAIGLVGVLWLLRRKPSSGDGKKTTHKAAPEEKEDALEWSNNLDEQIKQERIASAAISNQTIQEAVNYDSGVSDLKPESFGVSNCVGNEGALDSWKLGEAVGSYRSVNEQHFSDLHQEVGVCLPKVGQFQLETTKCDQLGSVSDNLYSNSQTQNSALADVIDHVIDVTFPNPTSSIREKPSTDSHVCDGHMWTDVEHLVKDLSLVSQPSQSLTVSECNQVVTLTNVSQNDQHGSLASSNRATYSGHFMSTETAKDSQCDTLMLLDIQQRDGINHIMLSDVQQGDDLMSPDAQEDDQCENAQQDCQSDSLMSSTAPTESCSDSLMSSIVQQDDQWDSVISSTTQDSEISSPVSLDDVQEGQLNNSSTTELDRDSLLTPSQKAYIEHQVNTALGDGLQEANKQLCKPVALPSSPSSSLEQLPSGSDSSRDSSEHEFVENSTAIGNDCTQEVGDSGLEEVHKNCHLPQDDQNMTSLRDGLCSDVVTDVSHPQAKSDFACHGCEPASHENLTLVNMGSLGSAVTSHLGSSELLSSSDAKCMESNTEPLDSASSGPVESAISQSVESANSKLLVSASNEPLESSSAGSLVAANSDFLASINTDFVESANAEPVESANAKTVESANAEPVELVNAELVESAKAELVELANAEPVESASAEPVESANAEPVESANTEPVESANTEPVESANAEPVESANAEPVESVNAEPVESVNAEPVESSNIEPVESGNAEPVKSANAEPVESANIEPVESANAEPVESANIEPVNSANAEPVESANAETVESANAEPVESANAEPVESVKAEPVESANAEPVESANAEPVESANIEPVESANIEPVESANIEPVESANIEPVESANIEPVESASAESLQSAKSELSRLSSPEPLRSFGTVRSEPIASDNKSPSAVQESSTSLPDSVALMRSSSNSSPVVSLQHVYIPCEVCRPAADFELGDQCGKLLSMDDGGTESNSDAITDATSVKAAPELKNNTMDTATMSTASEKVETRKSISWLPKASSSSIDSFGPDEIEALWGIESSMINFDAELTFLDSETVVVTGDSKALTKLEVGSSQPEVPGAASTVCQEKMLVMTTLMGQSDVRCDGAASDVGLKEAALVTSASPVCDSNSEGSNDSGRGGSEHDMVCQGAEVLVHFNFCMPSELCGQFIGKHGKHINYVKSQSGAHVSLSANPFLPEYQVCQVAGTQAEVDDALSMIRRKFPLQDYPYLTMEPIDMSLPVSLQPDSQVVYPEAMQLSLPEGVSVEVFVSAVVDAGQVFVQQPTHRSYMSLEKMNYFLNLVYSQDPNVPNVPLPIESGVICVCESEGFWYRAMIMSPVDENGEVQLKFVDYGGYITQPVAALKQIRVDFMNLPFQAVECFMANITPHQNEKLFSDEATQALCDLTQGKLLQCQVVARTEYGIPYIHLYQVNPERNSAVLINRALVNRRLVRWIEIL